MKTESSQDSSVGNSGAETNGTSVSSLCNGIISHSEDAECKKESSSSSLSSSVTVSENEREVAERVDTVDSESNPSIDMEHDHQVEAAANGKEDPTVENQAVDSPCSDITTSSLSATTESGEKEDSDTEMIDNAQ